MSTETLASTASAEFAGSRPRLRRELGLRDLTLFAISCVCSARWVPIAAHAGPSSLVLWLLAAVFFMAPLAIAVGTLVAKYPHTGGLYLWARCDFGRWNGFLCFWTYWVGIAFMFPTAALLYTKVGLSLFGPTLARLSEQRIFVLGATLGLIWSALGLNLIGLKFGKWVENLGGLSTWIVGLLLICVAGLIWMRQGSATAPSLVPSWNWQTLSFFAAIAYATSGMEGPGMMAGEMRDPERMMRRAGWIASGFATAFYVTATGALLVILPPEQISELNGFADVGNRAGQLLGAAWLSPLIAVLVLAGGVGLIGGVGTATSRLPFAPSVDGLLPKAFRSVHPRWGTPHWSTLALGVVATLLLIMCQLGDTLRAAYDELVSLMVITGFIPYLYIFASTWKAGRRVSALSGLATTLLALLCAVVPPPEIEKVWLFEGKLALGTLAVVVSAWILYERSTRTRI
ncbi:MAG: APC family permease [Proteobacteria bacterium]|nr:APC family permease [Pseudomonadota bacterium]